MEPISIEFSDITFNTASEKNLLPRFLTWLATSGVTSLKIKDGIDDNDAKEIASALRTNTTLTTLDLSDNDIGDDGAKEINRCLRQNSDIVTCLRILDKHPFVGDQTSSLYPCDTVQIWVSMMIIQDLKKGVALEEVKKRWVEVAACIHPIVESKNHAYDKMTGSPLLNHLFYHDLNSQSHL